MKPLPFLATALICFLFSSKLLAQEYVITIKGDSIPCKIKFPFGGSVKYKSDTMQKFNKVNTDEIKEYYSSDDSSLYRAVYVDNSKKPTFLEVVEKGKINLYQEVISSPPHSVTTGIAFSITAQNTIWYISKGSNYVQQLKNSNYTITGLFEKSRQKRENDLIEKIMDNKPVYEKFIADDSFSYKEIRNIIHLYNTGQPFKEKVELPAKEDTSNGFNPNQNQ